MSQPFIGEICPLPYMFSPSGWAYCSGQTLSVQQYTALYAIVGNTFGGTANQTFGVPNLKGIVPMGVGTGPGLTPRAYAASVGAANVQLTQSQLPNHTHDTKFAKGVSTMSNPQGNYLASLSEQTNPATSRYIYEKTLAVNTSFLSNALLPTGGNGAHENSQPFLALNFCIALQGMFPVKS
ncbi:MAG: tail fiber protein [Methylobacter sp.]